MNKIANGAALLIDPASVPSIRKAILSLMENEQLRSELVAKGFEIVKHYEAQYIAKQYIDLWSEIAKKNKI
jgi:glycosyltransferase involved in cell wall biosynthesis